MSASSRHERLRRRAELLARLRAFFETRGFLQVETPLLDLEIIPELHVEPFFSAPAGHWPAAQLDGISPEDFLWLQASPELHMKRLLAEGLPAIYQVTRSFRAGEC